MNFTSKRFGALVLRQFYATRPTSKPKKEKAVLPPVELVPPPPAVNITAAPAKATRARKIKVVENVEPVLSPSPATVPTPVKVTKPKKAKKVETVEAPVPIPAPKPVSVYVPHPHTPLVVPAVPTGSPILANTAANNALLNFPLCADHSAPEMAKLLAIDRVAELGMKRYPSVGAVMRETQTPQQIFLLKRWREKKVAELGSETEFYQYVQKIKSEGERLHNCLRLFLSAEMPEAQLPLSEPLKLLWSSFRPVLDKINSICAVETAVHHRPLGYTGIADCVAEIDGQLVVIDWKVSERQRTNLAQTYDTPIQIIAYIGALNAHYAWNEAQKLLTPQQAALVVKDSAHLYVPPKMIRYGLAVIGYRDGSPAHVHVIDEGACEFYWQKWLEKVHSFWAKKLTPSSPPNSSTPVAHNPQ